jgi:hypothetical protein
MSTPSLLDLIADPFLDDDPPVGPRLGTLTLLDQLVPDWPGYSDEPHEECPFCDEGARCECFTPIRDDEREPPL